MARKVDPSDIPAAVASASPEAAVGQDDLSVLHPDITLTIAGESITVREYGFIEGMGLRPVVAPLIADLCTLIVTKPLAEDVYDVLGTHVDLMRQAIAVSVDRDPAWVEALNDRDGDDLVQAWWTVCGPFFLRQVVRRWQERSARDAMPSAGPTSTTLSSTQGTDPSSDSAATPSAN